MSTRRTVRPHRDTVGVMREVAESMSEFDSMRSKLELAAQRLEHTECAASEVPDHDALVESIMSDWASIFDLGAEPGDEPATREQLARVAARAAAPALVAIEHQQNGDVPIGAGLEVALRRAREVVLRQGDWSLDWQDLEAIVGELDRTERLRGVIPDGVLCAVRPAHGAHVYLCADADGPGRPALRTCPGRA